MDRNFLFSYPDANKFFNGPKLYQITEKIKIVTLKMKEATPRDITVLAGVKDL